MKPPLEEEYLQCVVNSQPFETAVRLQERLLLTDKDQCVRCLSLAMPMSIICPYECADSLFEVIVAIDQNDNPTRYIR